VQKLSCSYCGKEYEARYIPKIPYCSSECRKRDNAKVCPICEKSFIPLRKTQIYCSKKCVDEQRHRESVVKRTRTCEVCGKEFVMRSMSGKGNRGEVNEGRFCSNKCRGEWQAKQRNGCISPEDPFKKKHGFKEGAYCRLYIGRCSHCGELFIRRKNTTRKFCSKECILANMRQEYKSKWVPPKPFKCQWCGKLHQPKYGEHSTVYCSETCRQRARRMLYYTSNNSYLRENAERNGEKFKAITVLLRDGWRCQLCGKKLNPKHRGTYRDDAPELDHVTPLSKGGEHSKRNTQCACRKCNLSKSNKALGQLRLFG